MTEPSVELLQFPYSHFNEKARWALDWKRIPHRRINLLPGPHAPRIQRLAGETTVPVVRFGSEVVQGSARIIDELERRFPEFPLYPEDPAERARALEIQRWFDEEVGPSARQAVFVGLLQDGDYVCRMFGEGQSVLKLRLYRAMYPIVRRKVSKAYALDDAAAVETALKTTRDALDFVAKESGSTGHLVGERFSVADLTAAALLALTCDPPDCAMTRPQPMPPALRRWIEDWSDHPGVGWVLRTYREHRSPSAAVS